MSENKTLNQAGIDAMSQKEFQTYAQEAFGVSLDVRKSKKDMVKAFVAAGGEIADGETDTDETQGAPQKVKAAQKGEVDITESDPRKYPKHVVEIHGQEGDAGGEDVFLSVNGHALLIKRNEKVAIPWTHLQALKNAVRTEYSQKNVGGEIQTIPRKVQAYNFTDHGRVED